MPKTAGAKKGSAEWGGSLLNPPPPKGAGRDETDLTNSESFCILRSKAQPHPYRRPPTTGHPRDRTFSTIFVRRQRGIGTFPVLAETSSEQKCATSTRIRHFSCQCPLLADNSPEQKRATSTIETNFSHVACSCWLLAALLATRWPPRSAT